MKAQMKVGNVTLEVEAGKQKDLFKALASAQEVFGETRCGLCKGEKLTMNWRVVTVVKGKKTETFEFPEYHCQGFVKVNENGKEVNRRCGARLAMGTLNDDTGTLYPQRRLITEGRPADQGRPPTKEERENGINGDYGPHNGWTRFKGEK